jgi:exopolysaccharide biosynthesis protein
MQSTDFFRLRVVAVACLLCAGANAFGEGWQQVAPGIEYRHLLRPGLDAHAVRVNLDDDCVQLIASTAGDRGLTVSEFAQRKAATVAVNGDYFDERFDPIGLAMGNGVVWARAREGTRRQEVVGVGGKRVEIFPRGTPLREPAPWMTGAVSGWPMLVEQCQPESRLPGSDFFTRAPHPRTALGLSGDRRRLLLLVAEGRREPVPGPTLRELAELMAELGSCTAVNLDGGGSSALWVGDRIVSRPSDGFERAVGNQLAIVMAPGCGSARPPDVTGRRPGDAFEP